MESAEQRGLASFSHRIYGHLHNEGAAIVDTQLLHKNDLYKDTDVMVYDDSKSSQMNLFNIQIKDFEAQDMSITQPDHKHPTIKVPYLKITLRIAKHAIMVSCDSGLSKMAKRVNDPKALQNAVSEANSFGGSSKLILDQQSRIVFGMIANWMDCRKMEHAKMNMGRFSREAIDAKKNGENAIAVTPAAYSSSSARRNKIDSLIIGLIDRFVTAAFYLQGRITFDGPVAKVFGNK